MTTEFQYRALCLLAPGFIKDPKGTGTYILEILPEQSSLISKHWTGDYFDNQELVATSIRPNSTASYLVDSSGSNQTVVCISTSSTIRTIHYDSDEEVWTDVKGFPTLEVLQAQGKIAAAFDEYGRIRIFFQDPHGFLIHFNAHRKTTASLPASPTSGSPISIAVVKSKIYVFYISARDHRIHYLTETSTDHWTDHTFSKCLLIDTIKQFIVEITTDNKFEVYALTNGNSLVQITRERKMSLLGKVDASGTFTSDRSIDHCCNDAWAGTLTEESLKSYLANDSLIINTPGGDKNLTPLAAACWRGHFSVVKILLDQGADPNALSPLKRTPLYYVTALSPPQNRVVIARALLTAGASVDECYEEQNYNTPLMNAISIISDQDLVRELLDRGASLSEENGSGQTAENIAEDMEMDLELISDSPRKSTSTPNEWEKRIMEFVVTLVMLLVQHFKYEDIFQEVMNEVAGTLGETDDAKAASDDEEDDED